MAEPTDEALVAVRQAVHVFNTTALPDEAAVAAANKVMHKALAAAGWTWNEETP